MNIPETSYQQVFNRSAFPTLILSAKDQHFTILDVNEAYLKMTGTVREFLIGKPVFSVFPQNPSDQVSDNIEKTILSFGQVIRTKEPHTMNQYRYDIPVPDTDLFLEKYWTTINVPLLDHHKNVSMIAQSPIDVTETIILEKKERNSNEALIKQREQLYSTFMQAPVGIGIFKGPDFIVDLVNPEICKIYGKNVEDLLGKPIFDVLEFAKGQGFEELLTNVRKTGKPYRGLDIEIPLVRNGVLQKVYVDFVYQPFYEDDLSISGVIGIATEVTSKVEATHLLEDAEERIRLATDAMDLGVFDLNFLDGKIITSVRFANIFGFSKPMQVNDYVKVIHPEDLQQRNNAHEYAIEFGHMMYEVRVIWPDQTIHWVKAEGKVLYDKKRNPIRMIGTLLDITGQKQAKEQQRKLITLVDNSVDLMAIFTMRGKTSYINQAGLELLGLGSVSNALSIPVSDLQTAENLEILKSKIIPAVIRYGSWAGHVKLRNYTTGEKIPVSAHYIRIDDNGTGKPISVGIIARDLRPEIIAKQALENSEQLLRNITTAAPTALWMSNKKGSLTYVNQTWIDWSGKSLQENKKSGWISVVYKDDVKKITQLYQEASLRYVQFEVEFRIVHADGSIRWCAASGQPQFDIRGQFSGYIGSSTDITDHKDLQSQKDNFIGIASHELKTPVTSLKGYTQVLERVLKKNGHLAEAGMVSKIDAQLNRLTSLINDLLDVTKINGDKLQFNDEIFEMQPMITDLVQNMRPSISKHQLIEIYNCKGITFADRDRIEQVVINLITNAIKYSPHGDKIIISLNQKGQEIIVCVEDFGIGISADHIANVFDQFYRVSGEMQHTYPGLGLGLYISAEIIKRANGQIWVESKKDNGSCFYFSLPAH